MHAQVASEDSELLGGIPAARLTLIERIAGAAGTGGARRELTQRSCAATSAASRRRTWRRAPPRDIWWAPRSRISPSGRAACRDARCTVFNPEMARDHFTSPHTLVLTVTDDMPFLVDSAAASPSGAPSSPCT